MSVYQAKQSVGRFTPASQAGAVETIDGATMLMQRITSSMLTTGAIGGRSATRMVAAATASVQMQAAADYLCDGTADDVEINAALASLPASGGTVLLSEGTFTLAAAISLNVTSQTLRGMGMGATILAAVSAGGTPVNVGLIQMNSAYGEVSDLTIDGNKANNAAQTSMIGIYVPATTSPSIRRVRVVNSAGDGIMVWNVAQNGVMRDCLVESSAARGIYVYAGAGQPFVISGCTSKSNGSGGFYIDGGPVTISDCQAISNTGRGFGIYAAAQATLSQCTASGSTTHGFYINAAVRAQVLACRALANTGYGFWTDGSQTQFVGCLAQGTLFGSGFTSALVSTDTSYVGCSAIGNSDMGFSIQSSAERSLYTGCRGISNTNGDFSLAGVEAHVRGCSSYGSGIYVAGDGPHIVHGCRIQNCGGYAILVNNVVASVQITNNFSSDVSLQSTGDYEHIEIAGDRVYIAGNMLRDPAAGNRPWAGIYLTSQATSGFIGHNDIYGAGTDNGVYLDAPATNRRPVKVQLDYIAATDLMNNVVSSANTWVDVTANQTFSVNSIRSYIEIACRGCMQAGARGSTQDETTLRLVIDSAGTPIYKRLSGGTTESTTSYANSFGGAGPVRLTGLATGNHTVKVQVLSSQANVHYYLRAVSAPTMEFLAIQVTEYLRA